MVRSILALLFAASASAFAPASQTATQTALNVSPDKEVGVLPPVGFLDPLGLIKNGPYGSPEDNFFHYRSVELKHGRIAMAATLGQLTAQNFHFDGYLSPSMDLKFSDIPNGLGALEAVPLLGWVQIAVVIGIHEIAVKQRDGKKPGDFGTGYFGIAMDDQSSKQLRALNVEVQNGRLAMLGILAMIASEKIHGVPLFETQIFG